MGTTGPQGSAGTEEPDGVLERLWDAWVGTDRAGGDAASEVPGREGEPPEDVEAVEVFGSDDVLSDQLASFGAVGDVSDGVLQDDGTSDVDWT
ncbi:hypothetical protein [Kineosporia sp. A_224]|uniref:hypothetical protein n=1 Tax=Kineosporia sp. A_224 TaxID=1962180 RepID=UPI00117BB09E|nr:hypothetical protein [Kineosporia sp. A_224]